jgi:hypothetical protein
MKNGELLTLQCPNPNYNFFEEEDEERKDLRWFPASKENLTLFCSHSDFMKNGELLTLQSPTLILIFGRRRMRRGRT